MRHKTTLLVLALLVSISAFSQNLGEISTEQLNKMKSEAILNENFEEAQRIKLEIESRKTVDELIAETKKEKNAAAAKEDFAKAAELKSKLEKLEQIKVLEKQIADAVSSENFETAQKLKVQKQKLWDEINAESATTTKSVAFNESASIAEGASTLRFDNYLNNNVKPVGGNYFDVIIDGKYLGTLNKYYELEIVNITPGQHEIVLIPSAFAGNPKSKFAFKSNFNFGNSKTYALRINDFESNKEFVRMVAENSRKAEKEKIFGITEASLNQNESKKIQSVNQVNPVYPKKKIYHADHAYSSITTNLNTLRTELPEERDRGFKFSLHSDNTIPIIRNTGIILGVGIDFSVITYRVPSLQYVGSTEFTGYYFGAHVGIGYQLEPLPFLTLQSQLRLNPGFNTSSTTIDGPSNYYDYSNDNSLNVSGIYNLTAMFFFNERQNFGLVTELNVALSNPVGTSFNIGIVLGGIKSPEQQHKKYQGKTLKY